MAEINLDLTTGKTTEKPSTGKELSDRQKLSSELETTYRDDRQQEYVERLSPEGDFQKSVGDMLDAITKAMYGDFSELDLLMVIIADVKQKHKRK